MEVSNEVKVKVFGMYLGQKIEYSSFLGDKEVFNELQLCSISIRDYKNNLSFSGLGKDNSQVHFDFYGSEYVKLILRTIDQLTDEEKDDLANILGVLSVDNFIIAIKENAPYALNIHKTIAAYQYLLSIGIDLPSIHLDGKTLIEAGLAIRKEETNGSK